MQILKPLFGNESLINAALWVADRLPENERRLHKIFKILWFADLAHLKKYGRTITGDTYVAMKFGPVPYFLYEEINSGRSASFRRESDRNGGIRPLRKPDPKYLSETETEELDRAVARYRDESFTRLTDISHGSAWKSAREAGPNTTIRIGEILDEIGADAELRENVREDIEIRNSIERLASVEDC